MVKVERDGQCAQDGEDRREQVSRRVDQSDEALNMIVLEHLLQLVFPSRLVIGEFAFAISCHLQISYYF